MLTLDADTGYLPPGVHFATLEQVEEVFGVGVKRRKIMDNLRMTLSELGELGVRQVWLDGSFVTSKWRPSDVDVIYKPPPGARTETWGHLAFSNHDALKADRMVDLWPHPSPQSLPGGGEEPLLAWFQRDRNNQPKGLVAVFLSLGDLK